MACAPCVDTDANPWEHRAMRTSLASILILAAATIGCGGKSKSEMTDPCKDPCKDEVVGSGEGEGHDGEGQHEEHAKHVMTPEMTAFHDVLAPLWHAEAGPARVDDTCEASGNMLDLGAGIQDGMLPEGVAEAEWQPAVQTLMISITHLQDACPQVPGGVTFEDAFTGVHDSFHGLLELMPKE